MPFRRHVEGGDLCAIYVHAGAGYHSVSNERNHLTAVNDAARVGMNLLRNGCDAYEAVEMAIRLLEDREITNAGFGSNLTLDGQVECDACIVDHFGRSGAVGAVSQIKNPITAARLVLEASTKPLSLQRVPPNLLVGEGATNFAAEHGMPVMPQDYLVSKGAKSRWANWKKDIAAADNKSTGRKSTPHQNHLSQHATPPTPSSPGNAPSSPVPPDHPLSRHPNAAAISRCSVPDTPSTTKNTNIAISPSLEEEDDSEDSATDDILAAVAAREPLPQPKRQKLNRSDGMNDEAHLLAEHLEALSRDEETEQMSADNQDRITDTVGAIAIDCFGRIAAGSSSGGIGMKHKGRCGPAALVGISTAVIPADSDDRHRVSVATVTSGTGEHMATTAAAQTAADRVKACVRKRHGQLESCTEDEALHSMIQNDFMRHPGVSNSPCPGAIGILCVKKTRQGIYFYFAHNTDSFAIASMHSDERRPVCVMSRSKGNASIAQGARKGKTLRATKQ